MKEWTRALTTLIGAAAAGALVWFVPHFSRWTVGGYWAEMALIALAGAVLGVSQLHGREGKPAPLFAIVFLPVLIVSGWVLLGSQPRGGWIRDHVVSWSGDIGVGHVVHNLGEHVAVLAFAAGLVFGLTFEPTMIPRRRRPAATAPAVTEPPPPEPMPAEEPAVPDSPDTAEAEPTAEVGPVESP